MPIPIYQVDAFTSEAFRGNPAAVCLLDAPRETEWMQNVAMEMNLAETAFLLKKDENEYDLRWMTPASEVDLCGHATLASAHVLYELSIINKTNAIAFNTRSGQLSASYSNGSIELNFPALDVSEESNSPKDILRAIHFDSANFIGKGSFDYLVELPSEKAVRELDPDFNLLKSIEMRGLIVTAIADKGKDYDFISRMFAPGVGIPEDPVTGSAHCALGPYWAGKLMSSSLTGYQASKRGGYVKVIVENDRVKLLGEAVTVFKGELLV